MSSTPPFDLPHWPRPPVPSCTLYRLNPAQREEPMDLQPGAQAESLEQCPNCPDRWSDIISLIRESLCFLVFFNLIGLTFPIQIRVCLYSTYYNLEKNWVKKIVVEMTGIHKSICVIRTMTYVPSRGCYCSCINLVIAVLTYDIFLGAFNINVHGRMYMSFFITSWN